MHTRVYRILEGGLSSKLYRCHAEVHQKYPTCIFIKFIFVVTVFKPFAINLWANERQINTHTPRKSACVYISVSHWPQNSFYINFLEKCYPKDKFRKSSRRICLIYFGMAPFNDYVKFRLWNLYINYLMLFNFHISLITIRFFCLLTDFSVDFYVAATKL